VIKEAKDVLQSVVEAKAPEAHIARSGAEESRLIMARQYPIVSLITNPGRFDETEARLYRYFNNESGMWQQRYARGARSVPVLLRVWAEGEDAADALFSRIIPAIPRRWVCDDFRGYVSVKSEEHSDFVDNVSKLYSSVAEIVFSVPVAGDVEPVPTFDKIETEQPEIEPLA
jgi:hypothetical protein